MPAPEPSHPDEPVAGDTRAACANCGHETVGAYCAACGQRAVSFQRPIHRLGREVMADYFGFDGKLWRTLVPLVTRPGALTNAYLDGRRNQYVRPVRLYLTASVALFFLLSVLPEGGVLSSAIVVKESGVPAATSTHRQDAVSDAVALGEIEREMARLDSARIALAGARDSLNRVMAGGTTLGAPPDTAAFAAELGFRERFGEMMEARAQRIGEMGQAGAQRWFVDAFASNMPKAMFLLLPLFALLLKGLYVRRGRYYGEHLIFALHTHAFAFLAFAALSLLVALGLDPDVLTGWPKVVAGATVLVLLGAVPIYVLLAMKRVYAQGWPRTVLKWAALVSAYVVALALGLAAVIMIAILLL